MKNERMIITFLRETAIEQMRKAGIYVREQDVDVSDNTTHMVIKMAIPMPFHDAANPNNAAAINYFGETTEAYISDNESTTRDQ